MDHIRQSRAEFGIILCNEHDAFRFYLFQGSRQFVCVERFVQDTHGTIVDGLLHELLDAETRHHVDAGCGPHPADFKEALDAVLAGHHDVHEGNVKIRFAIRFDRSVTTMRHEHFMAFHLKQLSERFSSVPVVINDQYSQWIAHCDITLRQNPHQNRKHTWQRKHSLTFGRSSNKQPTAASSNHRRVKIQLTRFTAPESKRLTFHWLIGLCADIDSNRTGKKSFPPRKSKTAPNVTSERC